MGVIGGLPPSLIADSMLHRLKQGAKKPGQFMEDGIPDEGHIGLLLRELKAQNDQMKRKEARRLQDLQELAQIAMSQK